MFFSALSSVPQCEHRSLIHSRDHRKNQMVIDVSRIEISDGQMLQTSGACLIAMHYVPSLRVCTQNQTRNVDILLHYLFIVLKKLQEADLDAEI